MKRYKLTLTFEFNDKREETEQCIQRKGLFYVEEQLAIGFSDPEFENVKCKLKEIENERD